MTTFGELGCRPKKLLGEFDITEQMVEDAIKANDQFIATLHAIRDAALGKLQ